MTALWTLILISAQLFFVVLAENPPGFINIDCGLDNGVTEATNTGLIYTSDDGYVESGEVHRISDTYITSGLYEQFKTVRSFPNGSRNCYTIKELTQGKKYLVVAWFQYGNYDGTSSNQISFDLYLDSQLWANVIVGIDDASSAYHFDILTIPQTKYTSVCLVNTNGGTPFISVLEFRPLHSTMYPQVVPGISLNLTARFNMGGTEYIRYSEDPYDRVWEPWSIPGCTSDSNNSSIYNISDSENPFEVPASVLQTWIYPTSSNNLTFNLDGIIINQAGENLLNHVFMTFTRFNQFATVIFTVNLDGDPWYTDPINVAYREPTSLFITNPFKMSSYIFSLVPTNDSTLKPILNALEIYNVLNASSDSEQPTYEQDMYAIMAIKEKYNVVKNWMGDPCFPKDLAWDGLNCSYESSSMNSPRIIILNVSRSGLTGSMISDFGDLTMLTKLDLSWNKLSGSMPSSLDQLTSLTFLDISGNNLILSPGLQKKQQSGALIVINSNSSAPCTSNCNKKKSWITIMIVVIVLSVLIVGVTTILCVWRRSESSLSEIGIKKYSSLKEKKDISAIEDTTADTDATADANQSISITTNNGIGNSVHTPDLLIPVRNSSAENHQNTPKDVLNIVETHQFSNKELEMITNKFDKKTIIGIGGFGSVHLGCFNNTQVAVKKLSKKSTQGEKQFLAEAKILTRVHHKHFVKFIGEGDCKALVYEYMHEGSLAGKLRGDNVRPLTWKQRLQIAHESAQGLDYLHNSCSPPLIHRDVKTNNILLNSNLEAKIADFGLSRALDKDNKTYLSTLVSTLVAGTPAYLDPEYSTSGRLTKMSDVYSFGVVLLEIVTGQPSIVTGQPSIVTSKAPLPEKPPNKSHIRQWVDERLPNIESAIDPSVQGQFDSNSINKFIQLARKCTEQSSYKRPTMGNIVAELKAILVLEISAEETRTTSMASTS